MMNNGKSSKKSGEMKCAAKQLAVEKGRRSNQSKEITPLKACKQLFKSDDWESSKFSLIPKSMTKKSLDRKHPTSKEIKKKTFPKNREKVVIVSKKSSSVRVVKSGMQRCTKNVQRSVSVKKVSYSTSVILSSDDDDADGDDESDSEDEEDDDDDDDDDSVKGHSSSKKRGTVIKHTMSRIRTEYSKSRKTDSRAVKKAKALKLLREKSKKKSNVTCRELRPRFPYSPTQEWPTARAHRMAGLNALAKVHVMYENEGRTHAESEENYLLELLSDDSSFTDSKSSKDSSREKPSMKDKSDDKEKSYNCSKRKKNDSKSKPPRKKKRTVDPVSPDVEIIDTKICKRMASLNAQAILAASYVQEKRQKKEKVKKLKEKQSDTSDGVEIKEIIMESCNLHILDSEKEPSPSHTDDSPQQPSSVVIEEVTDDVKKGMDVSNKKEQNGVCPVDAEDSANAVASTTVSEVGVTKYTKVTKVHINTTKEMEIKEEEGKADEKFQSLLEKDDVAITRTYHYQSNSSSQSYSVRMETTYKPMARNFSPTHHRSGQIPPPHVMGAVMPTRQNYYNYQNRPGILASQSYPMNRGVNNMQHMVGMDPHVQRQYGNGAFVPQYGPPPPHIPYPRNDYRYYQPAGPLIQPPHDQYMIHKPVPYHPQPHPQMHQTQPPATGAVTHPPSNHAHYSSGDFNRTSHPESSSSAPVKQNKISEIRSEPNAAQTENSEMYSNAAHAGRQMDKRTMAQGSNAYQQRHRNHPQPPLIHRQCPTQQEKLECYKYGCRGRQNYSNSQDIPTHTAPSYRERSPIYTVPNHNSLSYQSKSQNVLTHQDSVNCTSTSSQYPHPVSIMHPPPPDVNLPTKVDASRPHDKSYPEHRYDSNQFKNPMPQSQNMESGMMDRTNRSHLWRPPTVVDVESDSESRHTKTYIELDVPKACPRDKIIVVDVDKEDLKEPNDNVNISSYPSAQAKSIEQPEIIELSPTKFSDNRVSKCQIGKVPLDVSKESPDVMVIEVMKKREPPFIRRTKIHGKQRMCRDADNKPLPQYSSIKRSNVASSISIDPQNSVFQPQVALQRLVLPERTDIRPYHGWSWEGKPSEKLVYVTNDDPPFLRTCYSAIRHHEGDIINVRDCALLKSGARKTDLPYIAKITALWENPGDGEMMMSLLWYYRPEHTDPGKKPYHTDNEIFASKHCDTNSVACIEDKCYVLTFGEYCRYRGHCRMLESTSQSPVSVVPPIDDYPRKDRLPPPNISPEMVFFCRKVYDFRQKRILKNPM